MIRGTSTGGLIAILLGPLQMTVNECINAYTLLSDKVFEKKAYRVKISKRLQGRFDSAELKWAVKQIILDYSFSYDTLLKDSLDIPYKVYVHVTLANTY